MNWPRLLCKPFGTSVRHVKGKVAPTLITDIGTISAMAPAEQRIASKLRTQFHNLEGNPQQLLREFQRYKELVERERVRIELVSERYV